MNHGNQAAQPAPQSPIEAALSRLESAVTNLAQTEEQVAIRLACISVVVPMKEGAMPSEPQPISIAAQPMCAVEESLHKVIERIDNIAGHLRRVGTQLRV